MGKYILALDQGTTSSRCIIYDKKGNEIPVSAQLGAGFQVDAFLGSYKAGHQRREDSHQLTKHGHDDEE